ncbi:hypothetical protein D3C74_470590 [compost metagenome]
MAILVNPVFCMGGAKSNDKKVWLSSTNLSHNLLFLICLEKTMVSAFYDNSRITLSNDFHGLFTYAFLCS